MHQTFFGSTSKAWNFIFFPTFQVSGIIKFQFLDESYSQPSLQRHCLSPNNLTLNWIFCCNEFKFKLNWYICANTIDVVKNISVIKDVAIKSFHCILKAEFSLVNTVKPVLSGHSKEDQRLVVKTYYCLMQVKRIAECSIGAFCKVFRPALSYHLSLRPLFCLFLSGRLRQV